MLIELKTNYYCNKNSNQIYVKLFSALYSRTNLFIYQKYYKFQKYIKEKSIDYIFD